MKALLLAVLSLATVTPAIAVGAERTLHLDHLTLVGARAETVVYRGQRAIHLQSRIGREADDDSMLAIVPNSDFKDGIVELDARMTSWQRLRQESPGVYETYADPTAR